MTMPKTFPPKTPKAPSPNTDSRATEGKTSPTLENWQPRTHAVRAGINRAFQETSEAMFLTSGYAYDGPEQAAARFTGEDEGYIYSRYSNPTVGAFEERLGAIEGAAFCRATATGMAAVSASVLCQLSAGDHLVASRALFGSCRYVLDDLAGRFGITASFVDGTDLDAWAAAMTPRTKVFFLESPSNPGLEVLDIAAIAKIAHASGTKAGGAKLIVDNVFASPVLQRPLALGADIVVYSATKHIDGQGRVLGGAILTNDEAFIEDDLQPFMRHTGPSLSPFNAWVLLKSLETLDLRVSAMSDNAAILAAQLADLKHPFIKRTLYPHQDGHPQVGIAKAQMSKGGTLLTVEFDGDEQTAQARAFAFLGALKLIDVSNNLGDAKSLATHPRTTTHHRLSEEARLEQGVTPGLVRLSIGLEDVIDLWKDLAFALNQV